MKPARMPLKKLLCLTSICLTMFAYAATLQAEAPMVKTQAPGFYRMMVGQFEVTALSDGWVDMDRIFLGNASAEEIQRLLARSFKDAAKIPASSNAYLINTGSALVLVDAGAGIFGKGFGKLGELIKNLRAAGYQPSQVDAVLVTHMHGDHIGGLLTSSGERAFSKADIYVAKAEHGFFLNREITDKMPVEFQPYFKLARDVAKPYIAAGKWKTFEGGKLPFTGIAAVAIPGHTPGHTAYEIASGDQTLLVWGDLVHNAAAQFMNPDVFLVYDLDSKQAVTVRKALFRKLAERKILVSGMHLAFPGTGRLRMDGENAYSFVPVDFSPVE